MGSFANISGRIEISPPIPWKELSDSAYYKRATEGYYPHSLLFDVVETSEDIEEGVLVRREAVAIIPLDSGELRGNDIGNVLGAIVSEHGRGRAFTGRIEAWWPDFEFSSVRYKIIDGRVVEFEPSIIWSTESY